MLKLMLKLWSEFVVVDASVIAEENLLTGFPFIAYWFFNIIFRNCCWLPTSKPFYLRYVRTWINKNLKTRILAHMADKEVCELLSYLDQHIVWLMIFGMNALYIALDWAVLEIRQFLSAFSPVYFFLLLDSCIVDHDSSGKIGLMLCF